MTHVLRNITHRTISHAPIYNLLFKVFDLIVLKHLCQEENRMMPLYRDTCVTVQSSTLHAWWMIVKAVIFIHFLSGEPRVSEVDHIQQHEEVKNMW